MDQPRVVIRENLLTRKIEGGSAALAAFMSLLLLFTGLLEWSNTLRAQEWMSATAQQVFEKHEFWRAWSTLFVHADLRHLLANSLLFFILGAFVGGYFGVVAFPILAFVFGGVTNLIVLAHMKADIRLIGVSGVVFWLGGFWLVLYLMIDRRRTVVARAIRSGGVGLALFMPAEAFDPTVSYASHFIGFAFGVAAGLVYFLARREQILSAEVRETVYDDPEQELPPPPL